MVEGWLGSSLPTSWRKGLIRPDLAPRARSWANQEEGRAGRICVERSRRVCPSVASWPGATICGVAACVRVLSAACGATASGSGCGGSVWWPGEKVVRSGRIWLWRLDGGLSDACRVGLERLTRAKALSHAYPQFDSACGHR